MTKKSSLSTEKTLKTLKKPTESKHQAPLGLKRNDAEQKITGRAEYIDDLDFPHMLHAAIATSKVPHARLKKIYFEDAQAADGVHCVLTAKDIPGENSIGVASADQPLLATEKVRWLGDRLAIIAARSPREAREACILVEAEYEALPGIFDFDAALADGATLLHENHPTGNLAAKGCVYQGDTDKAFTEADIVIENTYDFNMQEHAYLETQGCIAVPEKDGSICIYASAQCPFYIQDAVAKVLALPLSKVRVIQTVTGGAFGGKEDYPSEPAACAALLAYETQKPVKLIYNRKEDMMWSSKREAQRVVHRLAAKKDGTLTAVEVKIYVDAGAYVGLAAIVADRGNSSALGPYLVPNVRVDTHTVYTNNAFSGAFRGFGHPQVAVATEAQLDILAQKAGISAYDVREKNMLRAGDLAATGEVLYAPVEALDTLNEAYRSIDYENLEKKVKAHNKENKRTRLGLGMATISYGACLHAGGQYLEGAAALLQIRRDGSVTYSVGNTELGQGSTSTLAQLVAENLGCLYENVSYTVVDTSLIPDSGPTVASRTTTMSGNAIVDACQKLKKVLQQSAAELLKCDVSEVIIGDGECKSLSGKISLNEAVDAAYCSKGQLMQLGWYAPPRKVWDVTKGQGQPYSAYSYATQIALVEVDTLTGRTRVKKVSAAHDVGAVIFPDGASGQIEGGIVQGMGYAIMERLNQKEGRILNPSLTDYIIPSVLDTPEIDVILIESQGVGEGQAAGPYGAKGLGEPSLIPICAAIGNAITNAIGERVFQMPFMPERVMDAMNKKTGLVDPLRAFRSAG